MGISNILAKIAGFAELRNTLNVGLAYVGFKDGWIYAQNETGGCCYAGGLDLECGVDAKRLIKALKAVSKEVKVSFKDKKLILKDNTKTISIPTVDIKVVAQFPEYPKKKGISVKGLNNVERVGWCKAGANEGRAHLQGIHVAGTYMEATNGHAFARYRLDIEGKLSEDGLLIPLEALVDLPERVELVETVSKLFISEDPEHVCYRICRCFSGKFPPIESILASVANLETLRVSRELFLDAVKSARISSETGFVAVRGNTVSVRVKDQPDSMSLFEFDESVEIEHLGKMTNGKIYFDLKLLYNALNASEGDAVEIGASPTDQGSLEALTVTDETGFFGIVMPKRC